jgi:hypothetical protein
MSQQVGKRGATISLGWRLVLISAYGVAPRPPSHSEGMGSALAGEACGKRSKCGADEFGALVRFFAGSSRSAAKEQI